MSGLGRCSFVRIGAWYLISLASDLSRNDVKLHAKNDTRWNSVNKMLKSILNRRMPNCTTVVQTASDLFEPEIRKNLITVSTE